MVKMELFQELFQEFAAFLMQELLFFITIHSKTVVIPQLQHNNRTIEHTITPFQLLIQLFLFFT